MWLLRESLGVWWPRLIAGFFSCPALLTPSAAGGGKGSPSSLGKKNWRHMMVAASW